MIVTRLSMSDQVYFFSPHFLISLAAKKIDCRHNSKSTMFDPDVSLSDLNSFSAGTMVQHLGIEFTELGNDFLKARMPVDHRTFQPLKMLHGGASTALAETLGSVAAHISVNRKTHYCVGMEINANHIKSVKNGYVYGIARALHLGKSTHVWEVRIEDESGALVCISRLTIAILKRSVDAEQNNVANG